MTKKNFYQGTLILILSGIIVKMIGFIYRIYLSNLLGPQGMGLYQLIIPVYSLVVMTLTSGISTAVSKMVAQETALARYGNGIKITNFSCVFALVSGVFSSFILYFSNNLIAQYALKDERTILSLTIISILLPLIVISATLKGYFYGLHDVVPVAAAQLVEQFVRVFLVYFLSFYIIQYGLEYSCALAVSGVALGEIFSFFVLLFLYFISLMRKKEHPVCCNQMRKRKILAEILKISIPVSINRFIMSIVSAVELILIPNMLLIGGLDYYKSIEEYGKLTGMALPLIVFPGIISASLAVTLVPAISESVSLNRIGAVKSRISKSIELTIHTGFLFMAIFLMYPYSISSITFKTDIGDLLFMLAPACVLIYLQQTFLGIMNGLGKQSIYLYSNLICYAVRIGFIIFLVPNLGIKGYILGLISSLIFINIFNFIVVKKHINLSLCFIKTLIIPLTTLPLLAIINKKIFDFFVYYGINFKFSLVAAISIFVVTYAGILIILDKDKIKLLKYSKK